MNTTTIYDDGVNEPIINTTEYSLPTCTYGQTYTLPLASTLTPFAKDGYNLIGWDTDSSADSVVYADGASFSNLTTTHNSVINLYAVYEEALPSHSKTFSANTAAQVSGVSAYIAENNLTSQQVYDTFGWSLGDSINVGYATAYIIGFNHDDKADGSGKAGITLFTSGCGTSQMATSNNQASYYESSLYSKVGSVRTTFLSTDWQSVNVDITKYFTTLSNSKLSATSYSVQAWPLSLLELTSTGYYESANLGGEHQYEIFESELYDSVLTSTKFWLRDCGYANDYAYYSGSALGTSVASATNSYSVRFAFCV